MGSACCGNKVQPKSPTPTQSRSKSVHPPVTPDYEIPKIISPPMRRENSAMQRFNTIGIAINKNPLDFIKGYLNEPLVSLEEALEPFDDQIYDLSDYIREAKTKCHFPSEDKLTRDESAAIYIYTRKWDHGCLYDHLQAAWASSNSDVLKPWHKYLKLLKTAFDKLPNTKKEIWQGTIYDEKLKEQLTSGSALLYSSMGSCCGSEQELKEYIQRNGDKKVILIGYESVDGKIVTNYTAGNSKEYMVWPGMQLGKNPKYIIADKYGSITIHFSGTVMKVPEVIKPLIIEKHFVCRNKYCDNRCRRKHEPLHCYGFAFITHNCQHHCGPPQRCFLCNKNVHSLYECNKCQSRYCEKCCIK